MTIADQLTEEQRMVYIALLKMPKRDGTDEQGLTVLDLDHAPDRLVAEATGLSKRRVQRHLHVLRDMGLSGYTPGGRGLHTWTVLIPGSNGAKSGNGQQQMQLEASAETQETHELNLPDWFNDFSALCKNIGDVPDMLLDVLREAAELRESNAGLEKHNTELERMLAERNAELTSLKDIVASISAMIPVHLAEQTGD